MSPLVPVSPSGSDMTAGCLRALCLLRPVHFRPVLFCFTILVLTACSDKEADFAKRVTDKDVAQIFDDAEFAITERNFRINNRLHIGKAIRKRGQGSFPDYEVTLFCNLSYAKRMLDLAPEFISYCPQRLAIRDTGRQRIITASLLPHKTSNAALNSVAAEINTLVREIVDFAAKDWPELDEQ